MSGMRSGLLLLRRTAASTPAAAGSNDPIKAIFLEKLREYQKTKAVDHKTRVMRVLQERAKERAGSKK